MLLKWKDQKKKNKTRNQNKLINKETTVAYSNIRNLFILYQGLEVSDPSWQHNFASDGHLDAQTPSILF